MIRELIHSVLRRRGRRIVRWPMKKALALESHVCELLALVPINCVLDVGGHRGETGLMFRANGYRGRIVSFEPIAANLEIIRQHAAADHDWQVIPKALGDEASSSSMFTAASTVLSSLHKPTEHGVAHFGESLSTTQVQQVEVCRLDEIAAQCLAGISKPVVYLKIDTQGHDLAVLRGAVETLKQVQVLQMEAAVRPIYEGGGRFQDVFEVAESLGFKLSGFLIGSRNRNLALNEMDAVFVR
jgi:FkbM family methyltransferase